MEKTAEVCHTHLELFNKFTELPLEQQTEDNFPYDRHMDIEDQFDRYMAIIGPVGEDRDFVFETYKYSKSPCLRPQDKKKQDQESPTEPIDDDNELELYKKGRQDWLKFLKGCFYLIATDITRLLFFLLICFFNLLFQRLDFYFTIIPPRFSEVVPRRLLPLENSKTWYAYLRLSTRKIHLLSIQEGRNGTKIDYRRKRFS